MKRINRRAFLKGFSGTALALLFAQGAAKGEAPLRVSGAGAVLSGPFPALAPEPGRPPGMFLVALFGFDETFLFWQIPTNPDGGFILPTAQLGEIEIERFGFFLGLQSTEIESVTVQAREGTDLEATLTGQARSIVVLPFEGEPFRQFEESARFTAKALDLGTPGVAVGDAFQLSVEYDPGGMHAKLFGEKADLHIAQEGRIILGNIVVQG